MVGEEVNQCPQCGLTLYREVSQCPRCFAPIQPADSLPPMVERIYEPGPGEKAPKERKNTRRTFAIIFVLIIVTIIVLALAFNFLIPRMDIKIFTAYTESSGLAINLDFKVKNEGTLGIQHYSMNVTVYNSSGGVVAKKDYYSSDIDPKSTEKFDNIHFFGDQYEQYKITLDIDFESEGKNYEKTFNHKVSEAMRLRWEDSFMEWGG
jgi:hypothetical protein